MKKNHYTKFRKKSVFLLTAEHASSRIPREYGNLGLKRFEIAGAKDLYDPGSLDVLRFLEKKLQASYLYSGISRLVVDCNRILDGKSKNNNCFHSGAMKKELLVENNSEEIIVKIPANNFSAEKTFIEEEKRRYSKYAEPYRKAGHFLADKIANRNGRTILIMLHSFFPVYDGDRRKVDIGVLYDSSKQAAIKIISSLRKNSKLVIGNNSPWKMSDVDGGIFGRLQERKNIELIAFDINNRNLQTKKGSEMIGELIYQAIKDM